jgi:hypothetical protein
MTATPLSLVASGRASVRDAMFASLSAREFARYDLHSPICVFDLCEKLGVAVRFNDIASLEGMYERSTPPRIHLSSLRPLGRRRFNCAHELGHHIFRHGSTIHELRSKHAEKRSYNSEEFVANAFAAFLLLPALGVAEAFAARNVSPECASPRQVFAVSCDFGVGYSTLITHLVRSLNELSPQRANVLLRHSPKTLREELALRPVNTALTLLDEHCLSTSTDIEVGSLILLPTGTRILGDQLIHIDEVGSLSLLEAVKPGIVRAVRRPPLSPIFVRVSKKQFVGLARYRHLGATDDDQ